VLHCDSCKATTEHSGARTNGRRDRVEAVAANVTTRGSERPRRTDHAEEVIRTVAAKKKAAKKKGTKKKAAKKKK
jgi:hypothetical protein